MKQDFKCDQHCRASLLTRLHLKCTSKKVSAAVEVYVCVWGQASWVRTLLTEPADPVGRSHCSCIQSQTLYCNSLSKCRTPFLHCFLLHTYLQSVSIHMFHFFVCLSLSFPSPQIFLSSPKPLVLLQNKHVLFELLFRNTLRVQPCWAIRTKFKAKLVVQQQFWWAAEKFICTNI